MKKLLLLLLVLPFVFSSCSSDDNHIPSLKTTVWESIEDDKKVVAVFSDIECFVATSRVSSGAVMSTQEYSYAYVHPKATMYPKDSKYAKLECTISSDYKKMTLVNTSTNKTIVTLTKK